MGIINAYNEGINSIFQILLVKLMNTRGWGQNNCNLTLEILATQMDSPFGQPNSLVS